MADQAESELRRARWRRARDPLGLAIPEGEAFATGGLARHVEGLSVRFLIVPGDPEGTVVHFDEAFWACWKTERESSFQGRVSWGHYWHPTADAAVCHDQRGGDSWSWDTYLALHRHGGVEEPFGQVVAHREVRSLLRGPGTPLCQLEHGRAC